MIHKCVVIFISVVLLIKTVRSNDEQKLCNLRENSHPQEIWNFWAGYWCYNFTNTYRLNPNKNVKVIQGFYRNQSIPIGTFSDSEIHFHFNYRDDNSSYLRPAFRSDYFFKMWQDCAQEAEHCCNEKMNNENIHGTEEYPCPAIWDGWTCFDPAKSGTTAKQVCSKQAYSTESDVCELKSHKVCFKNGTWNQQTDYSVCAIAPILRNRHNFNVIALIVSTILSFPAVVIFFSLRTFRKNLRYIFHRNLILVIVIRNLLTIMTKEIIILDALKTTGSNGVMATDSPFCKILAFFENAAKNGMYACMLADGFYLHKLIVRAFANEPSIIYIYVSVALLSFVPSLAWAIARAAHGAVDCWMVDDSGDQWIIDGFRIVIIAINCLLLLDIIRVMAMKLKSSSTPQQTKATLRATLFLIPLFGVHIIVITNRQMVPDNTCTSQNIYYYISYSIEGLQGIMVAVLFCYINSQVRKELRNSLRKVVLQLESRFGLRLHKDRNFKRNTASTFVSPYEHK